MKKVLLTGAGGFIGGAVLRKLIARGVEVETLGRGEQAPLPGATHHQLDLLEVEPSKLRKLLKVAACDRLIHAAWYTNHADYLVSDANRAWLHGSVALFEAFREAGPGRIVGLGTCFEYASEGGRYSEATTPLRPDTLYGQCKKDLATKLLGMRDTAWARIFYVYGPGDRAGRLVPHLLEAARSGKPVSVRFGGLRRDYIHIDDLAEQILTLSAGDLTGAVNTGTGRAVPLSKIAKAAALAAGRSELAELNDRVDVAQPLVVEADMERYTNVFGPIPSRPLVDGLKPLV